MFCFAKYLSQSPFFEKFLKSEGVCSPCYCDGPIFTETGFAAGKQRKENIGKDLENVFRR